MRIKKNCHFKNQTQPICFVNGWKFTAGPMSEADCRKMLAEKGGHEAGFSMCYADSACIYRMLNDGTDLSWAFLQITLRG